MERICQVVTSTSYPCLAKHVFGSHLFGDWPILKNLPRMFTYLFFGLLTKEINLDDDLMFGEICLDLPCLHTCLLCLKSDEPGQVRVRFALPLLEEMRIRGTHRFCQLGARLAP